MGAHHRDEGITRRLGLEKVRGRKLGVIRYWIRAAHFKLDPQPARCALILK